MNKDAMKGLRSILTNFEILLFLVMMFICGIMYGFVETFLFVFLKEDLHAPMYLLGLTITTGAVVSLPFLYYSDSIVKKVITITPCHKYLLECHATAACLTPLCIVSLILDGSL